MSRFRYYNNNPYGLTEQDCVTRAITLASGNMSYNEVKYKLNLIADLYDCEKLCICCYKIFIEQILKGKPMRCDGLTIGEFADLHPKGTFLLRVDGHLNCVINNVCFDLFDCRDMKITDAWQIF